GPPGLRRPRPWPRRGRASARADTRSSRRVRAARRARAGRREDVQYLLAVLRELRLPHATHLAQVGQGRRPRRRDLAQRRVVEDHVGRHALLLGGGGTPRPDLPPAPRRPPRPPPPPLPAAP